MAKILAAFPKENVARAFTPAMVEELGRLAPTVWADVGRTKTKAEDYRALLAREKPEVLMTFWGASMLTADVYRENPQLKYMCHVSGELHRILERGCLEGGLLVTNWGDVISRTISEHSLLMILASLRQITKCTIDMHVRKAWVHPETRSLFERTVGLHGLGPIAQELVPLLRPFNVKISAFSPNAPDEAFKRLGVRKAASLKALYAENDIVSIHTGNTPQNFHIVNAELLKCMKDGAVLVNTARGPIVDTQALVAELKTGRIFAALDVFEEELIPPFGGLAADSPLRGMENCLLTPHEGGPTPDRLVDCGRLAIDNIGRYLRGEQTVNQINLKRFDAMT
jgi:phosphoglycerate dehydrogenase-like enzyme